MLLANLYDETLLSVMRLRPADFVYLMPDFLKHESLVHSTTVSLSHSLILWFDSNITVTSSVAHCYITLILACDLVLRDGVETCRSERSQQIKSSLYLISFVDCRTALCPHAPSLSDRPPSV